MSLQIGDSPPGIFSPPYKWRKFRTLRETHKWLTGEFFFFSPRQYWHEVMKAQQLIRSGVLGDLLSVRVPRSARPSASRCCAAVNVPMEFITPIYRSSRGRSRSPWLLTTYQSWDDLPHELSSVGVGAEPHPDTYWKHQPKKTPSGISKGHHFYFYFLTYWLNYAEQKNKKR